MVRASLARHGGSLFSYAKSQPLASISAARQELKELMQARDMRDWESRRRWLQRMELASCSHDYKRPVQNSDFFEAAQSYMLEICTYLRTSGPSSEADILKNVKIPKRLGVKRFLQEGVLLNFCRQRALVFDISDDGLISYKQKANSRWQIPDYKKKTAAKDHEYEGYANRHQPKPGWEWE